MIHRSRSTRSSTAWLVLGLGLGGPAAIVASCDLPSTGGSSSPASALGQASQVAAGCPDLSSVQAAARIDWASEFKIDAKVGGNIGAGVMAALELKGFAARLDADLVTACGSLAKDLGKDGSWTTGKDACQAAMSAMAEAKAKLGAGVKIALTIEPPRCAASMDAMAECVGGCDVDVEPGSVEIECEPGKLAGGCEGQCSGTCELSAAAKCGGTCHGSCSANFSGTCGGQCSGKCDGTRVNKAECAGRCEGSCSAAAEGQCGGQCSGSCDLKGSAKCGGTCHGSCTVEMKAPRCEGEMTPPKASAECKAKCDAQVQAKLECTPAKVGVVVQGAADAQLAARYAAALRKNLPLVLKIAVGMKDQALAVAANVEAVAKGVQATIGGLKGQAPRSRRG